MTSPAKSSGFTLIELLIVIAIVSVLAAVLVPNLINSRRRAFDTLAQSCAKQIALAQHIHQIDTDSYAGAVAMLDPNVVLGCDPTWISAFSGDAVTFEASVRHPGGSFTHTITPAGLSQSP